MYGYVLCIHLSVDIHLGCCHILAVVNNGCCNEYGCKSVRVPAFIYLGYIPISRAGLYGNSLTSWRTAKLFSTVAVLFYIPTSNYKFPISSDSHWHVFSFYLFIIIVILVGMKWCLIVILIFLSLMTMLSVFSCSCWWFIYIWRNVYSSFLPIFLSGLFIVDL